MFHLTCGQCQHAVLAVVLENQSGVSSIGLVTDMEVQDAVRMQDALPITSDDVIRAHAYLANQSRQFCRSLVS
jgi:hypothetical protein